MTHCTALHLPLWRWDAWHWWPGEERWLATSWTGTRSHPGTQTISNDVDDTQREAVSVVTDKTSTTGVVPNNTHTSTRNMQSEGNIHSFIHFQKPVTTDKTATVRTNVPVA